jgi:hypothetical protein
MKIPKPDFENWVVEYRFENDGRFLEFAFAEADNPLCYADRWVQTLALSRFVVHSTEQNL